MKKVLMADPVRYPRMTTSELRETFLLSGMHEPGKLILTYVDLDRTVAGIAWRSDRAAGLSRTARKLLYRAPRTGRAQYRRQRQRERWG